MPDYPRGDNIHLTLEVRDAAGMLVDADTVKVTITDPDGTVKVNAQNATHYGTGIYSYDWQSVKTDKRGYYLALWEVTTGGKTDESYYEFSLDVGLTSLDNLKKALQIEAGNIENDELLSSMIVRASALVEAYLQRRLLRDTYTGQRLNGSGSCYLFTPQYPIASVSEIKIYSTPIDAEQSDGDGGYFLSNADAGEIYYPGGFPSGVGNVRISYVAGFSHVPEDIEQAVIELCTLWYEHGEPGVVSESQAGVSFQYAQDAIPEDIKAKLRPYRKPITASISGA